VQRFPLNMGPACSAKVSLDLRPLLHIVDQIMFCVFPHAMEKDSKPTTSLISMQVVPYRTHGGTCYPVVFTPMIWSLAGSSNQIL
jgi:hypothetical protein